MQTHQETKQVATNYKLLSIEQAKEHLSVSRPTINRLISGGTLRIVKIGRSVRIPEAALIELISAGGKSKI